MSEVEHILRETIDSLLDMVEENHREAVIADVTKVLREYSPIDELVADARNALQSISLLLFEVEDVQNGGFPRVSEETLQDAKKSVERVKGLLGKVSPIIRKETT